MFAWIFFFSKLRRKEQTSGDIFNWVYHNILFQNICLQEPGRTERAFGRYDVATVLKKFYAAEIDELIAPPGVEIIDFLQAPSSPLPWMTDDELGQYAEKFQKTGFTGPLNYYCMMECNLHTLCSPLDVLYSVLLNSAVRSLQKLEAYCTLEWSENHSACKVHS
jgi:hypothetical protein